MDVIYQDSGSEQLTGKQLKEIAAMLPDDAKIDVLAATNTQRDGWVWQIKAKASAVPRPHKPGIRGSVKNQVGLGREKGIDEL